MGAGTVLVDLSEISFIDSSALEVLVRESKRLEGRGQLLVLVTNDPRNDGVLEVTGLDGVLRAYATLQDAPCRAEPRAVAADRRGLEGWR